MSHANVEQSLGAVEQALSHFASSLDRAGFSEGAAAYQEMAGVVVGQWLWVQQERARDLEPGFRRVAELAETISGQLVPYVEAMQRLSALQGLVAERWGVDPDSVAGKIVEALSGSDRPMTTAEIKASTGVPTSTVRRQLGELVEQDLVLKHGKGRPRYALAERAPGES